MLKVIVTGGIGSGKSSAIEFFKQHGIPIIDTDVIARQLTEEDAVLNKITHEFGKQVLTSEGTLDRRNLRDIIFADNDAREKLQDILHPLIHQQVQQELAALSSKYPYCIIVIPLFVESKQDYPHDRILLIDIDKNNQISRASQRDQQNSHQIEKIIACQASREQRLAVADDVIENNGDIESLRQQVNQFHQRYLEIAKTMA